MLYPGGIYLYQLLHKRPIIKVIIGFICLVVCSYLFILCLNDYNRFNKVPTRVTTKEAILLLSTNQNELITITDVSADCQKNILSLGNQYTEIPYKDSNNTMLVIGVFSRYSQCFKYSRMLTGTGYLYKPSDKFIPILNKRINFQLNQFKYSDQAIVVCTYCGSDNVKWGIIGSVIGLLAGVIFIVDGYSKHVIFSKNTRSRSKGKH